MRTLFLNPAGRQALPTCNLSKLKENAERASSDDDQFGPHKIRVDLSEPASFGMWCI